MLSADEASLRQQSRQQDRSPHTDLHHADMCSATTALHSETLDPDLAARFREFVSAQPQPQIILGTQSVSRRAVVDELAQQFAFKVSSITADIDEKAIRTPDPKDLVMMLAHAKARAIAKKLKDSGSYIKPGYLVTCDQVMTLSCNRWSPEGSAFGILNSGFVHSDVVAFRFRRRSLIRCPRTSVLP